MSDDKREAAIRRAHASMEAAGAALYNIQQSSNSEARIGAAEHRYRMAEGRYHEVVGDE